MTSTSFISEVLPGADHERHPGTPLAILELEMGKMPQGFPFTQWTEQMERYANYWSWWQGKELEEIKGTTADGEHVYKFPLRINTARTYSRIHNNMLWGEVPDDSTPPVRAKVKPKPSLFSDEVADEEKKIARFYERVINEVWDASDSRAILWESGLLSQFLGGAYFQISYEPWRTDLLIPLVIKPLKADFVLPVWSPSNPWELLEAWVVYRMTPASANEMYGTEFGGTYVTYVEHWTRTRYSILLDGKPLQATYFVPGAEKPYTIKYDKRPNPFGIVPITYIPRIREGSFWGSSLIPDILGLMLELNGRMADSGDVIRQTNHRKWFGHNVTQTPRAKQFDNGEWYIDLGNENPAHKNPPKIWAEDPPKWSQIMTEFNDDLRGEMEREGFVSPIAFGLDEGSQRSGTTLQIRMWPTISMARSQRYFWTVGLNYVARNVLIMLAALRIKIDGHVIPQDVLRQFTVGQQWYPFLPRDEEQATNRIVLLKQSGAMSTRRAVELQEDVEDIDEELKEIDSDQQKLAEFTAQGNDQGAAAKPDAPVATTNLEDGE